MTYYKIHITTGSNEAHQAIQPILKKANVVKREFMIVRRFTIRTMKDHLFSDLVKALESKGIDDHEYRISSKPYERKAPKKRKRHQNKR